MLKESQQKPKPSVPRSREHEEIPAAGREKNAEGWKKHISMYVQGSPSGCVRREIPWVTQVDEKGHAGNTAVVTAYMFLSKNLKMSAVSTTDWMVETQLCKLRGTLDTFFGRAYSILHFEFGVCELNLRYGC